MGNGEESEASSLCLANLVNPKELQSKTSRVEWRDIKKLPDAEAMRPG